MLWYSSKTARTTTKKNTLELLRRHSSLCFATNTTVGCLFMCNLHMCDNGWGLGKGHACLRGQSGLVNAAVECVPFYEYGALESRCQPILQLEGQGPLEPASWTEPAEWAAPTLLRCLPIFCSPEKSSAAPQRFTNHYVFAVGKTWLKWPRHTHTRLWQHINTNMD